MVYRANPDAIVSEDAGTVAQALEQVENAIFIGHPGVSEKIQAALAQGS